MKTLKLKVVSGKEARQTNKASNSTFLHEAFHHVVTSTIQPTALLYSLSSSLSLSVEE
jgi:hypothetical protein